MSQAGSLSGNGGGEARELDTLVLILPVPDEGFT